MRAKLREPVLRAWQRKAAKAVLFAAGIGSIFGGSAGAQEPVSLAPRAGVTLAVEYYAAAAARANAVLFIGGSGVVAVTQKNFLLRIRPALVAGGLNIAVPDAPSDHRSGLDTAFRASGEYGQDIAAVVAFLKQKAALPVWLIGTSNGSVAAANGAVRLGPAQLSGVVLTSSVWSGGMSYVPLDQLAIPVLIIHNRNDRCPASNVAGAQQALQILTRAPRKELLEFSSEASKSAPCEAQSPHGYLGIEDEVALAMLRWMVNRS